MDYYRQNGAPHSDDPVDAADKDDYDYAPVLSDNEEESPMQCYRLDEDTDIVGDKVYIDGEGVPVVKSKLNSAMDAINSVDLNVSPGLQPGYLEMVGSYVLAAVIGLVIFSTLVYYALMVYRQPQGATVAFFKKWAVKWPINWWFCPPGADAAVGK